MRVLEPDLQQSLRLVHLTDPHLGPMPMYAWHHWNLKRSLGFANWQRNRHALHERATLDRITDDLERHSADHILVSGDLCNIGLPEEMDRAAAWLSTLGPPDRVAVVPGNHDVYTRLWRDPGLARWADYMASNAAGQRLFDGDVSPQSSFGALTFPFVRRIGPVALIALNSAIFTAPGIAAGRLGPQQCAALAKLLQAAGQAGLFRLVMLHHPVLLKAKRWQRGLRDASALRDVLYRSGAELVVHGHNHLNELHWIEGPADPVPIVGLASASAAFRHHGRPRAAYHVYTLRAPQQATEQTMPQATAPWPIDCARYGLERDRGDVVRLSQFTIAAPVDRPIAAPHARRYRN